MNNSSELMLVFFRDAFTEYDAKSRRTIASAVDPDLDIMVMLYSFW